MTVDRSAKCRDFQTHLPLRSLSTQLYEDSKQSFQEALTRNHAVNQKSVRYHHGPTSYGSPLYQGVREKPRIKRSVSVPARSHRLNRPNEEYRVEFFSDDRNSYPGVMLVSILPAEPVEPEKPEEPTDGDDEAEPEQEAPKPATKRRTKKARHWVDEITVSSTRPTKPAQTTGTEQEPETATEVLPGYACPSSEQKSREFAIRSWLSNTSFSCSAKTVPMV